MSHPIAVSNHIIFQFEEDHVKHLGVNQFKERTDWNFEFAITTDGMETGRWATIVSVGPESDPDLQPGMTICVDKLKWTTSFKFNNQDYWRTDSDQVILIKE